MNRNAFSLLLSTVILGLTSPLAHSQVPPSAGLLAAEVDLDPAPSNGYLEIYDLQFTQLMRLKEQLRATKNHFGTLQYRYKSSHPRILAMQDQLDVLEEEIQSTRLALLKTEDKLSEGERAFIHERHSTKLELEVQNTRIELARLLTRYKPKWPSVIEAKTRLANLEETLANLRERRREDPQELNFGLERSKLDAALLKLQGELKQLQQRYRDKHPFVIEAKAKIEILEGEMAQLQTMQSAQQIRTENPQKGTVRERDAAARALLKEEISLIEDHLTQSSKPDQATPRELTQMQLELLELKQELAELEGRPVNKGQLLEEQLVLLERILKSTNSAEESFRLKRQIIAIKRDRLERSE